MKRYALIPAGGRGTRLWPLSRSAAAANSKPFLPLIDGRSLLELAWQRLDGIVEPDRRLICAAAAARNVVCRILPDLHPTSWLGEPCGRDTLAAITLGCAVAARRDPNAVVAMIPADLFFTPDPLFRRTLRTAFELVERCPGRLLTFGVHPTAAATGYGYLEPGEPLPLATGLSNTRSGDTECTDTEDNSNSYPSDDRVDDVRQLVRFREKPDTDTAKTFVQKGFLWNVGVLVTGAAIFGEHVQRCEPEMHERITRIADVWETPHRSAALAEHYPHLKRISVDHAILNRIAAPDGPMAVLELPTTLRWSDIGSWNAPELYAAPDDAGNATNCRTGDHGNNDGVTFVGAKNCAIFVDPEGQRPLRVRMIGTDRLIVVVMDDIVLATTRDAIQQVRELADRQFRPTPRTLHGHTDFIGCGNCRIALDRCGRRIVTLGLDNIRIIADRRTLTLIASTPSVPASPETCPSCSFHRWKTIEWFSIR